MMVNEFVVSCLTSEFLSFDTRSNKRKIAILLRYWLSEYSFQSLFTCFFTIFLNVLVWTAYMSRAAIILAQLSLVKLKSILCRLHRDHFVGVNSSLYFRKKFIGNMHRTDQTDHISEWDYYFINNTERVFKHNHVVSTFIIN